jgi:hypothetical protein
VSPAAPVSTDAELAQPERSGPAPRNPPDRSPRGLAAARTPSRPQRRFGPGLVVITTPPCHPITGSPDHRVGKQRRCRGRNDPVSSAAHLVWWPKFCHQTNQSAGMSMRRGRGARVAPVFDVFATDDSVHQPCDHLIEESDDFVHLVPGLDSAVRSSAASANVVWRLA